MTRVGTIYHLLAFILDIVFICLLFMAVDLSYHQIKIFQGQSFNPMDEGVYYYKTIFFFLVLMLVATEAFTGVTLGKLCTGIHPVTKKGIRGSVWFYLMRFVLRYLPFWLLLIFKYLDIYNYAGILVGVWAVINLGTWLFFGLMFHEIVISSVTVFRKNIQQPQA